MMGSLRAWVTLGATLLSGLMLVAVQAPAHANEPAGVYDVTTDRTLYGASGSMTVTYRTVAPVGMLNPVLVGTTCTLNVRGTLKDPIPCDSGVAFDYPDINFQGYNNTQNSVIVTASYRPAGCRTCTVSEVSGETTAVAFDGSRPTAAVAGIYTWNASGSAVGPAADRLHLSPSTHYVADVRANDNLDVQNVSCRLERTSAPAADPVPFSCMGQFGDGGMSHFNTPGTGGSYDVVVDVSDPAGNVGTVRYAIVVDTVAPALTFTAGPTEGQSTSAADVTWSWTADEAATYKCAVIAQGGSATLTTCTSPFTASGLSTGAKQLQIQATDSLGNTGITTVNFTVDRTKPTLTLNAPTGAYTTTSSNVPFNVSSDEPVRFRCAQQDPNGNFTYVDCSFGQFKVSWAGSINAEYGTHAYSFIGVDAAGNSSDPVTFTYTRNYPDAVLTWQSGPAAGSTVRESRPTWTWTSSSSSPTYECSLVAHGATPAYSACSSPYGAPMALSDGGYDFSVRTSGSDVSTTASTITFTVDTTPVVTPPPPPPPPPAPAPAPAPAPLLVTSGRALIAGVPKVGRILRASAAPWTPGTTVRYQWFANGKRIPGATRATLRLKRAQAGKRISVTITGSRAGYLPKAVTTPRTAQVRR